MTAEQRARVARAIRTIGATETARRLGLSTEATLRVGGDFGSQPGTEDRAVLRLPRLDDEREASPQSAA